MPSTPLAPLELERCRSLPQPALTGCWRHSATTVSQGPPPRSPCTAPGLRARRRQTKPMGTVQYPPVSGAALSIHDQRRWGLEHTVSHLSHLCLNRWSCGRANRTSLALQPQVALLRHTVAIEPAPLRRATAVATGSVAPFSAWHLPSFLPSPSRPPTTPTSHRRAGSPPPPLPRPTSTARCGAAALSAPHHLPVTSHTV